MRKSILVVCMIFVVISAVILPVAAAPTPPKPDPLTEIWNWVKAMQQWTKSVSDQLGTIVTKLTTLQTDVTSIKRAPPEPTSYEYYTALMNPRGDVKQTSIYDYEDLTNWGDSPADVCCYKYIQHATDAWELKVSKCQSIQPGEITTVCSPTIVSDWNTRYKLKFTTNSKYVVPRAYLSYIDHEVIDSYLPGDFQRVEIYS